MPDADDAAIVRQIVRAVAAAILCLFCGGVFAVVAIRTDYNRDGAGRQRVGLAQPEIRSR